MVNGMPSVEIAFSISFLRLCRRGLLPIIDRRSKRDWKRTSRDAYSSMGGRHFPLICSAVLPTRAKFDCYTVRSTKLCLLCGLAEVGFSEILVILKPCTY